MDDDMNGRDEGILCNVLELLQHMMRLPAPGRALAMGAIEHERPWVREAAVLCLGCHMDAAALGRLLQMRDVEVSESVVQAIDDVLSVT